MILLYQFIEVSLSFMEIYIGYKICRMFFDFKKQRNERQLLLLVCCLTFVTFLYNQVLLFSNILLLITILFITCTSHFLYKCKLKEVFSIVLFYFFFIFLLDIFGVVLAALITRNPNYGILLIEGYSINRIVFICTIKMILYINYKLLGKYSCKFIIAVKKYPVWLIGIALIGYLGLFYFQRIVFSVLTTMYIMNWYFYLILVAMSITLFWVYIRYRCLSENKDIIELRNHLVENKYNSLKQAYDCHAKAFHDSKNHYLILHKFIQDDKKEAALKYLNALKGPLEEMDNKIFTGHEIIDYILNRKLEEAQKKNIMVDVETKIYRCDVKDYDLCSILTNLLDNAMEACTYVQKEHRWMNISMKTINNMLMIKVQNNFKQPPRQQGTSFKTIKKEKSLHGLGLDIVTSIAKKYEGKVDIHYTDDVFEVMLTLLSA